MEAPARGKGSLRACSGEYSGRHTLHCEGPLHSKQVHWNKATGAKRQLVVVSTNKILAIMASLCSCDLLWFVAALPLLTAPVVDILQSCFKAVPFSHTCARQLPAPQHWLHFGVYRVPCYAGEQCSDGTHHGGAQATSGLCMRQPRLHALHMMRHDVVSAVHSTAGQVVHRMPPRSGNERDGWLGNRPSCERHTSRVLDLNIRDTVCLIEHYNLC